MLSQGNPPTQIVRLAGVLCKNHSQTAWFGRHVNFTTRLAEGTNQLCFPVQHGCPPETAPSLFKTRLQPRLHINAPQKRFVFSPDELVHELPALSVHRRKERPDKGEHEHRLHALLEVFRRFWRLPDDAFEWPELLEVAVQDVHQTLNQAAVHLTRQ